MTRARDTEPRSSLGRGKATARKICYGNGMDDAQRQLDTFIDKFTPEVAALTRALLAKMKAQKNGSDRRRPGPMNSALQQGRPRFRLNHDCRAHKSWPAFILSVATGGVYGPGGERLGGARLAEQPRAAQEHFEPGHREQ